MNNFDFYVITDGKNFLHLEPISYLFDKVTDVAEILFLNPMWADNFASIAEAKDVMEEFNLDTSKYKIQKCKVKYSLEDC